MTDQVTAELVAEVARTYDLHPNQLCRWSTEYFRGEYGADTARSAAWDVLGGEGG